MSSFLLCLPVLSISFHLITAKKAQSYHNLPEEDKEKVKSILFIMDKFSVSLQAYHELAQQEQTLPRSYLIEACQQSLDDKWV